MTKNVFCLLYSGMPIEGFSAASGHPIFTGNDKFIPNYSFDSYGSALNGLAYMVQTVLDQNHDTVDTSLISIGSIKMECQDISTHISVFDTVFDNLVKTWDNSPLVSERYVKKIIYLCVRKGFRTVLPEHHQVLFTNPRFVELMDEHVPFFIQQNIERFMDVGISTCTPEEIAAIILTSSDELLKAIRIDSLNNVSK